MKKKKNRKLVGMGMSIVLEPELWELVHMVGIVTSFKAQQAGRSIRLNAGGTLTTMIREMLLRHAKEIQEEFQRVKLRRLRGHVGGVDTLAAIGLSNDAFMAGPSNTARPDQHRRDEFGRYTKKGTVSGDTSVEAGSVVSGQPGQPEKVRTGSSRKYQRTVFHAT